MGVALCASVAACGKLDFFGQDREAWRDAEEARCLRAGELRPSQFAEPLPAIRQKGVCGLQSPFKVSGLDEGRVSINPPARLGCPMNTALNTWLRDVVQPAAYANYGQPIVGIKNIASYGCRTRNNKPGAPLSEHSFGNALDIKAFFLADGRTVDIRSAWYKGTPQAQAFLRQVQSGACGTFKTVLGPGSDGFHEDHFHLDLARHKSGRAVCNPRPQYVPSAPPPQPQYYPPPQQQYQPYPYYDPPEVSQQPMPQPQQTYPQQYPYPQQQYPNDPAVTPDDQYTVNTPLSYAPMPKQWPIARVPSPYTGSIGANAR